MTFRPTVSAIQAEHRLAWLGKFGIRGLFDGEHSFTLEPFDDGRATRFVHAENFSGVVGRVAGKMLARTAKGFQQFNEAIKQRAEEIVALTPG
jgi:hypothetical protein